MNVYLCNTFSSARFRMLSKRSSSNSGNTVIISMRGYFSNLFQPIVLQGSRQQYVIERLWALLSDTTFSRI